MLLRYSFLLGLLCTLIASPARAVPPISKAQARSLYPAVANVMLQRDSTTSLLVYCARQFGSLQNASRDARQTWLQRNRAILHKAEVLRTRLWLALKQQQSGLKAETFNLDIDDLVQKSVHQELQSLGMYAKPQQRTICNHLILAVRAGDWDISRKQAHAYAILKNFH